MSWISAVIAVLLLWGSYTIFGDRANQVHGEKVTMAFEALAFVILSLIVCFKSRADFGRMTTVSAINASVMALMSAGGFYFLLYALRVASDKLSLIVMIVGFYPVITVLVVAALSKFHVFGQRGHLNGKQWAGVALAVLAIILINSADKTPTEQSSTHQLVQPSTTPSAS